MVPERSERRKRTQKICSRRVLSRTPKVVRNRKCRAKPRFSRDLVTRRAKTAFLARRPLRGREW